MSLKSKSISSRFNPREIVKALDKYKKDSDTYDEKILNIQNIKQLLNALDKIKTEKTRKETAMLIMSFLFSRIYIKRMENPNYLKELSEKKTLRASMNPDEKFSKAHELYKLSVDIQKLLKIKTEIDELEDVLYNHGLGNYLFNEKTNSTRGGKKHLRKKTYKTKTLKYKNGANNSYRNR